MMGVPAGVRIWLVAGVTDMRKGMDTLCALVQTALNDSPFSGQLFIFRGRRGDKIKILWHKAEGLCLFCKRIDRGRFIWPQATSGAVLLTAAQLSMLLEGIDWRRPERTAVREIDPTPPTLSA
jgi:transposase